MKWNFKIDLQHKPLPPVIRSNIILREIYVELKPRKERNVMETALVPFNVNKMSFLTHFIPHIYYLDWENMEIIESIFY